MHRSEIVVMVGNDLFNRVILFGSELDAYDITTKPRVETSSIIGLKFASSGRICQARITLLKDGVFQIWNCDMMCTLDLRCALAACAPSMGRSRRSQQKNNVRRDGKSNVRGYDIVQFRMGMVSLTNQPAIDDEADESETEEDCAMTRVYCTKQFNRRR
ncbi:hypothetical protein Nepgr_019489 [Nepenthes gracilis]|uniref:Uncharacterized protein n=1 Tax=Nepenthes gracilis TaxID=150966 RepID=A0AAD3SU44_NEPGR|nr:hypothetical protein Nepgr_019489 [Nepenthes gracilis]